MRVLELGCGTGGITRLLLERGVAVTAVDGSERMLARARRRAPGYAPVRSYWARQVC
ncbi:MAG: class I SAM-dependent methyltransferase [Planctomycetes bacterium]|nr:class I SAM-dependent methyltransferase [Planctomycetota bacterium]